jgi:CubicO group peptidase (beta-lactamase class C family)
MLRTQALASLSIATLSLCSSACSDDAATARAEETAEVDFTAFDAAINQFVADHDLRGASAAVVQRGAGVVHLAGYGEFTPQRTYLVMSSSKVLSAGILMHLSDAGLLDIDAPIGDYVPEWTVGKPELTVAQLMSGSSGLVGIVDSPLYAPYACRTNTATTLTDCARKIYEADDAAERKSPDTEFHYGGAAWQLAGGIAEVVSGKPWAELVRERYSVPCDVPELGYTNGLNILGVTFNPDGTIASFTVPPAFEGDPSRLPVTENPNLEAGVFTSVGDYAKLLDVHIDGGKCGDARVLSEAAVERMQADRAVAYGSTEDQMRSLLGAADAAVVDQAVGLSGYGLGWWVLRDEPGVFFDPGALGSNAFLDVPRGYGAFFATESDLATGIEGGFALKAVLDEAFDASQVTSRR